MANENFLELVKENQKSRLKAIQTAEKLYTFKKNLCQNEIPNLIRHVQSVQNIPEEFQSTITQIESNICSDKNLIPVNNILKAIIPQDKLEIVTNTFGDKLLQNFELSTSLSEESDSLTSPATFAAAVISSIPVIGAVLGFPSIFQIMAQKKKFKAQLQKKTESTQSSTEIFQSAINKMEFLLASTEEQAHDISESVSGLGEKPKNFEMMSLKQREELSALVSRMNILTEALNQKIT